MAKCSASQHLSRLSQVIPKEEPSLSRKLNNSKGKKEKNHEVLCASEKCVREMVLNQGCCDLPDTALKHIAPLITVLHHET